MCVDLLLKGASGRGYKVRNLALRACGAHGVLRDVEGARVKAYPSGSKYPNSRVSRSKKPFRVWILGPETLLFGYLDPLGIVDG